MTREQVCSQVPHCLSCPLSLGSVECYKLEQKEIDSIMDIYRKLESVPERYILTKEVLESMLRKENNQ